MLPTAKAGGAECGRQPLIQLWPAPLSHTEDKCADSVCDVDDGTLLGVWSFERRSRARPASAGARIASRETSGCGRHSFFFLWLFSRRRGSSA